MTINQILNLDCREPEGVEIIQEYLREIKPLAKYEIDVYVPLYKIEKVITILSKKYNIRIRDIIPDIWSNESETIWKVVLIDDRNLNQVGIIYGLSLYEVVAKTAIYMYAIRNKIGERSKEI